MTKSVRGLPALELDVASPEELLPSSVAVIDIGGHSVQAYTLERITGEKLRAFLSSLPKYRTKVHKPGQAVRARDLHDITRVQQKFPIEEVDFWEKVAQEFHIACRSRYIDCDGLETFHENWDVTRRTYEESALPDDISFDDVSRALEQVVAYMVKIKIIPFTFPLPEDAKN